MRLAAKIEIAARHRLEPLRQSDVDGLCAILSALNAVRLALADHAPINKAKSKELFAAGVDYLHRKDGLRAAVISGVGTKRRLALTRHLAKQVSAINCQVVVECPNHSAWTSIQDPFDWIDGSLAAGKPVLASLVGSIDHYTVVAGSTPATLQLFDSSGHQFLRKSSCGLRCGYHQLPPQGLLRVAVGRTE
jgi:hypothetical protein